MLLRSDIVDGSIQIVTQDLFRILETSFSKKDVFFPKYKNVDNRGNNLEIESGHYSEIPLNDILEIKIQGSPNSPVEIIIRCG